MFRDVFWVDGMKLRRSVVWPVIVLVPIFLSVVGVNNYAEHRDVFRGENLLGWMGACYMGIHTMEKFRDAHCFEHRFCVTQCVYHQFLHGPNLSLVPTRICYDAV
jgi:hypothetical protein